MYISKNGNPFTRIHDNIVLASISGQNIIAVTNNYRNMLFSFNGGQSWEELPEPLTNYRILDAQISGQNIIFSTMDGECFYNINGEWQQLSNFGLYSVKIDGTSLAAYENHSKVLFYNFNGHWKQKSFIDISNKNYLQSFSLSNKNMLLTWFGKQPVYYLDSIKAWINIDLPPIDYNNTNFSGQISGENLVLAVSGAFFGYNPVIFYKLKDEEVQAAQFIPPAQGEFVIPVVPQEPNLPLPWSIAISNFTILISYLNQGVFSYTIANPMDQCVLEHSQILLHNNEYIFIEELNTNHKLKSPFSSEPQKIKKILKRQVVYDAESKNMPIKIPRSHFGENVPETDVYISGHHRIFLSTSSQNELLGVQAYKVIDNFVVLDEIKEKFGEPFLYYHVELEDATQPIIVSNLVIESYQNE